MTRFGDAKGRKVVSTSTAETLGRIGGFVVNAKESRVLALSLKKTAGKADTLRWPDLHAFGGDAVTVTGAQAIVEAGPDVTRWSDKAHRVLGKRVLSVGGDELGEVTDVEFDDTTGVIGALVLNDGEPTACRLVGAGSYAVVVDLGQPATV